MQKRGELFVAGDFLQKGGGSLRTAAFEQHSRRSLLVCHSGLYWFAPGGLNRLSPPQLCFSCAKVYLKQVELDETMLVAGIARPIPRVSKWKDGASNVEVFSLAACANPARIPHP